jgi:hypothetical protein
VTNRLAACLCAAGLALFAALVYLHALGQTPIALHGDEVQFAMQSYSIATTGRDLNGHSMPFFFAIADPLIKNNHTIVWFQPMLFYLQAVALKVLPLSEAAIRAPTVVIGVIDVVLLFAVGRYVFPRMWQAALAAALLAISPAHVIFSRVAMDYICPLPFVLGWLLCLASYFRQRREWLLVAAGLLLGAGFFSYIAAWVMMPLYVAVTCIALWWTSDRRVRAILLVCGGFAVPLFAGWVWSNPVMIHDTLLRYKIIGAPRDPLFGGQGGIGVEVLTRASVYWDYFNPSYLFLSGGSRLVDSTRRAGVLLAPMAVFLVVGVVDLWRRRDVVFNRILLAGLLLAPVAAAMLDERYRSDRELVLLPFGVLISVFGVSRLWTRHGVARLAVLALCLASAIQFAFFYRDYLTDYRVRSEVWFDPYDFRKISQYVVSTDAEQRVPAVYLSPLIDYAGYRWKFYLQQRDRNDLFERTQYLPANADLSGVVPGSLLVFASQDPALDTVLKTGRCTVAATVLNEVGSKAAVVLRVAG